MCSSYSVFLHEAKYRRLYHYPSRGTVRFSKPTESILSVRSSIVLLILNKDLHRYPQCGFHIKDSMSYILLQFWENLWHIVCDLLPPFPNSGVPHNICPVTLLADLPARLYIISRIGKRYLFSRLCYFQYWQKSYIVAHFHGTRVFWWKS